MMSDYNIDLGERWVSSVPALMAMIVAEGQAIARQIKGLVKNVYRTFCSPFCNNSKLAIANPCSIYEGKVSNCFFYV